MSSASKKKILALIPARGGSRGLPGKNIKKFAGKPLIAWTIAAAKKSEHVSRVVVSTDAKDIAAISSEYGAQVILRPKNLATDTAPVSGAVLHTLDWFKDQGEVFNLLVLLQPTSPLRTSKDIDKAILTFLKSKADSLASVSPADHPPYWMFKTEPLTNLPPGRSGERVEEYLKPLFSQKYLKMRKQDIPETCRPNGAIYVLPTKTFLKHKKFYIGKVIPYIMPAERSVDIDTLTDFLFAEMVFKRIKHT